jgi:hypothetical protein
VVYVILVRTQHWGVLQIKHLLLCADYCWRERGGRRPDFRSCMQANTKGSLKHGKGPPKETCLCKNYNSTCFLHLLDVVHIANEHESNFHCGWGGHARRGHGRKGS